MSLFIQHSVWNTNEIDQTVNVLLVLLVWDRFEAELILDWALLSLFMRTRGSCLSAHVLLSRVFGTKNREG